MHNKLKYNGKLSTDMGLVIQTTPVYNVPKRDVTTTHVPGRNGDIVVDNGCYENVKREYSLAKAYDLPCAPVQGTVLNAQEIYEWLTSAKGKYVELEDDYDPTVYRLATFVGGGNIGDIFDKAFTYMAEFNCKPQRFLKTGKIPVENEPGPTVTINNLFHYEAKPIIKIENLPSGGTETTMLSIKSLEDDSLKEKCLITLRDLSEDEVVYIDSENENCYNDDDKEINDKVALNGNNFPKLLEGNNVVSVKQFDRHEYEDIPSYSTILNDKQTVCESSYSPKETTIASYENKYKVRSYSTLIAEKEYTLNGDAYQTRITEVCDANPTYGDGPSTGKIKDIARSYTIEAFTTALANYSIILTCPNISAAEYSDIFDASEVAQYCELVSISNGYKIVVKQATTELYIWAVRNKRIQYFKSGDTIVQKLTSDKSEDVTFYIDVVKQVSEQDFHTLAAVEYINEVLPNWLTLEPTYTVEDDFKAFFTSVKYKLNLSDYNNNAVCYYWTDKIGLTGLFGKAGWHLGHHDDVILECKWDKLKQGFVPNGSIISKATSGVAIRFVAYNEPNATDLVQYDFGVNSLKLFDVLIDSNNVSMERCYLKALQTGYYKINDNIWVHANANETISLPSGQTTVALSVNTTKALTAHYLKDIPSYRNEIDWPTWLNPIPVYNPSNGILLNAQTINFVLNQNAFYRIWHVNESGEELVTVPFTEREIGDKASFILSAGSAVDDNVSVKEELTIGQYDCPIEEWASPYDVPSFLYDRAFSVNGAAPTLGSKPSWLRYSLSMKVAFDAEPDTEIEMYRKPSFDYPSQGNPEYFVGLKVGQMGDTPTDKVCFTPKEFMNVNERVIQAKYDGHDSPEFTPDLGKESGKINDEASFVFHSGNGTGNGGYYKYDNTTAWVYHAPNESDDTFIAKINYKDTITFYYLQNLPEYSDYYPEGEEPEWLDCFDIEHLPANENPLNVKFKIKTGHAGYYKLNTSTNWKYYDVGEEFTTCLINENIIIAHLIPKSDESVLDNVVITITPNWWLL